MKKIRNSQDLQSEKARLISEIAEERAALAHDFRIIASHLTPLSIGAFLGKKLISTVFSSSSRNGSSSNGGTATASWMPANGLVQKGIEYGSAWLVSKMIKNPLLKMVTVLGLPVLVRYYPVVSNAVRRWWSKESRDSRY